MDKRKHYQEQIKLAKSNTKCRWQLINEFTRDNKKRCYPTLRLKTKIYPIQARSQNILSVFLITLALI